MRTGCSSGASPQGHIHLNGTTMMLNGYDYLQAHRRRPTESRHRHAGTNAGPHPTPGVSLRLTSSVASSMNHHAAARVDPVELAATAVCTGANPWVAPWAVLERAASAGDPRGAGGLRVPASVPGIPNQCVPVTGTPLSTPAAFWDDLPANLGGLIDAVLTDTPGVEVTGRWRLANGSAAFTAAVEAGLAPPLALDHWNTLSLCTDETAGPLVRQWAHHTAWATLSDLPEEALHDLVPGSGVEGRRVRTLLGLYEQNPIMTAVDGDRGVISARLAAAAVAVRALAQASLPSASEHTSTMCVPMRTPASALAR